MDTNYKKTAIRVFFWQTDCFINDTTLAVAKMQRMERTVQTTGIRWQNDFYWDAALAEHVGHKVTVLYNRLDDTSLTILYKNDFVCEAVRRERLRLVGEDKRFGWREFCESKRDTLCDRGVVQCFTEWKIIGSTYIYAMEDFRYARRTIFLRNMESV